MNQDEEVDCLVVGGGPAGLTAAIYLARFRRTVLVVDGNSSRASLIPKTHNYPGFADGISGIALLKRLRDQATQYGARIHEGLMTSLEPTGAGLRGQVGSHFVAAGRSSSRLASSTKSRCCPICAESEALRTGFRRKPDSVPMIADRR